VFDIFGCTLAAIDDDEEIKTQHQVILVITGILDLSTSIVHPLAPSDKSIMNDPDKEKTRVLFSQAHQEQLMLAENAEDKAQFSLLRQTLSDWGYLPVSIDEPLTPDQLQDAQILVLGAPKGGLEEKEIRAIEQFIQSGGGILLIANAETMFGPLPGLNKIAAIAGLQFQKYHNYQPTFVQVFWPHSITANVRRIKVGDIAALDSNEGARPLACTRATKQLVMACADVERGRVVAIGDLGWLEDKQLADENNKELAANTFRWLAGRNVIDIMQLDIPETVKWEQTARVDLHLRNGDAKARPQVKCVLESDADALIELAHKDRSIPPNETTLFHWTVRPQILGEQKLRLSVYVDGHEPLFFDRLQPAMRCLAPGYFTLEIKDAEGKLKTVFCTGDHFTVEGVFHWETELEQPSHQLALELDDGLVKRGFEQGYGVNRWSVQATAPGTHKLALKLKETCQSLPALVTVRSSATDRLAEIKAAYVYPLEAEIAERLRQVDESLSHPQVLGQPFEILPPEEFVRQVYKPETASWLLGVLASARREQWHNPELLDLVLTHIAPTYLPNRGSFIPYDPGLASRLTELHHNYKRYLEYNLLCSEESEPVSVRQNVAAFLLHEKFGHGFFYTQTRLGQQLALLRFHEYPQEYRDVVQLIKDSAIIVNEGFAAWLELTFLGKLDRDVRQAVYPRQVLLLKEATGLYKPKRRGDDFFEVFRPPFGTRYRGGFEYLDFIGQKFNLRCTVRVFLVATSIDYGIAEDAQGNLEFKRDPIELKQLLLDPTRPEWRSQSRLHDMFKLLKNHAGDLEKLVHKQYCPGDCRQRGCPLESFIAEKLKWRVL
jgi:hypothetical protein